MISETRFFVSTFGAVGPFVCCVRYESVNIDKFVAAEFCHSVAGCRLVLHSDSLENKAVLLGELGTLSVGL